MPITKRDYRMVLCDTTCVSLLQPQKMALKKIAKTVKRTAAKLYYTSFWDKFGINVNYFGMHPKT